VTATPTAPRPASPLDALRFAFGTLSVLPVRVSRWDRSAARGGMTAAPLVGVVIGLGAALAGGVLLRLGASPLTAAVAAVAAPAALTRGLHLDGLADTADGLGSGKPAEDALRIMKQSDIGPFGVVVLVLVLLAQVAALADSYGGGWRDGGGAAVAAAVAGRGAMTLACRRGVPAARPEGLGAAVASAVPRATAACVAALCVVLAAAATASWRGGLAAAVGLLCAELLLRRCVRRFAGVTGDVFGALCEVAATSAYITLTFH
jgi:adenosylcobinamide-GDP ribazoletransferase